MTTIQSDEAREALRPPRLAVLLLLSMGACALDPDATDRDDTTTQATAAVTDPNDTSPIEPPPRELVIHSATSRAINYSFKCGAHATHHDVMRRDGDGNVVNVAFLNVCQIGFFLTDSDVQPGISYCYQVIGSNSEQSGVSDEACTTAALDFEPPSTPSLARLDVAQTDATLEFVDTATNEGGFRVYLRTGAGPFNLIQTFPRAVRADRGTGQHFPVTRTGLARDTDYTFKVEVFHDFAPVSAERVFNFTTLPDPPQVPANFRVTGTTGTTLSLAWGDSVNESSYDLDMTLGVGNQDRTLPANSTSVTLTDLFPSSTYCFKLRAVNRAGSASTGEVCGKTQSGSQTFDVILQPDPPTSGLLAYAGLLGPLTGFVLNSLEVRATANDLRMTAFAFIPATSPSSACHDPAVRVLVPINGSASGADLTKLYGSTAPSISNGIVIRGCVSPETLPVSVRPIITAHVTTP